MSKKLIFIGATIFLISLVLTGCGSSGGGDINQTLQGKIANQDFTFVSGYATTNSFDSTKWSVYLHKINPIGGVDPWATGAYTGSYPYVSFTLVKTDPAQQYAVTTLGTPSGGKPGIVVLGWTDALNGVIFDSGTLTITEINLTGNTITGQMSATTNEGTSTLLGTFTVPINPI